MHEQKKASDFCVGHMATAPTLAVSRREKKAAVTLFAINEKIHTSACERRILTPQNDFMWTESLFETLFHLNSVYGSFSCVLWILPPDVADIRQVNSDLDARAKKILLWRDSTFCWSAFRSMQRLNYSAAFWGQTELVKPSIYHNVRLSLKLSEKGIRVQHIWLMSREFKGVLEGQCTFIDPCGFAGRKKKT